MSVTIRATVAIKPGARLYYDCPLKGGDYKSEQFFEQHRGKYATFIGYAEKLVDVLNTHGLVPGRYLNPKDILVQFDGEDPLELNAQHFIISHEDYGRLVNASDEEQRLGDLPHPLLFYPGDTVRFKNKPPNCPTDDVRQVRQIFLGKPFTLNDVPRYEVMETTAEASLRVRKFHEENGKRPEEDRLLWSSALDIMHGWNTAGDDIELVARGNVWALYNDPAKLMFESDDAEAAFWFQYGICRFVEDDVKMFVLGMPKHVINSTFGLSLENAYRLFTAQYADVIVPTFSNPGDGPRYNAKVVHKCFEQHRYRIRALTAKLWTHQLKQPAA